MLRLARSLALLAVAGAAFAGCGGGVQGPATTAKATGAAPVPSLRGVPQDGLSLGSPDAKVVVVEFIDVQCPFCQEFEQGVVPTLLHDYVRTGKIRFEQRTMSFLGPDSVRGARFLGAAARQDRQFDVAALLFRDQGPENSGYLDDAFLRKVGAQVKGFDTARALREMRGARGQEPLGAANSMAQRYGVRGTPTVLIGPDITSLERIESPTVKKPDAYTAAIDAALSGTHRSSPPLPPPPNAPRPQPPAGAGGDLKA